MFTIGVVGRCLSKTLIEGRRLDAQCRQLVLVAAPKDFRSYFQPGDNTNAVVQMVRGTQGHPATQLCVPHNRQHALRVLNPTQGLHQTRTECD
jgi:hypothetical protein